MTEKRVWLFREGNAKMRAELGGKGANLAEMTNLGLPIPPGLTITTATCMDYINNGNKMPSGLMEEVKQKLKDVEKQYKGSKITFKENEKYRNMKEKLDEVPQVIEYAKLALNKSGFKKISPWRDNSISFI